ncbi:MAG TPA: GntR family transcriptional regulator [Syntrophorhabdales bacterium]|nr:GntR family transcriptional regulator [Syntrophorhabdales bacterium]
MSAARMGVQKTAHRPLRGIKAVGKPLPVGEVAYASLKQAIVKGDLHPGQRLVESKLSAKMLISRIPVREAIKKLEQDGLVEKLPRGGFIVKNPSREEIDETFGIRAVLEGFAAALATRHMDQATFKRLEVTLEWYRDALKQGDTTKMMHLNDQLDEIIFGASGNKRLRALIGNFRDFISRYRRVLLTCLDYAAISLADHEKIVAAMNEGDPEKVEQLMRRHLTRGKEILIKDMDAGLEF